MGGLWAFGVAGSAMAVVMVALEAAIAVEQALPTTRKHQSSQSHAVRAFVVIVGPIIVACWLPVGLAAKCG
jgi:hypothetical protein